MFVCLFNFGNNACYQMYLQSLNCALDMTTSGCLQSSLISAGASFMWTELVAPPCGQTLHRNDVETHPLSTHFFKSCPSCRSPRRREFIGQSSPVRSDVVFPNLRRPLKSASIGQLCIPTFLLVLPPPHSHLPSQNPSAR